MNRRVFLRAAGAGAAAAAVPRSLRGAVPPVRPEVAITIDDFHFADGPLLSGAERNGRLLDHLRKRGVRAAAFVAGKNADSATTMPLVAEWAAQGHLISNHTYSHPNYPETELGRFTEDILHCERILEKLPTYTKMFRFPYLKEGDTADQRDRMRAFLHEHGYRNGHVTIDASDWYVDSRLRDRVGADPRANLTPYRDYYLDHIWGRAQYYDDLARRVLGRTVKHTLLVHHNVLNGLFLGDLLTMFVARGWRLVDASAAFADPVFGAEPKIAPAGESLVWALAKESGKGAQALRYPGESDEYEKPRMDALGL